MIQFVKGCLREIREGFVVLEAGGIGYGIRVPLSLHPALPALGEELKLYTYFSVRQDAMELFGFLAPEDREMFVMLLSVSGVGPKGALGVLSVLSPDALRTAVVTGNSKAIQAAPGIGKRTAERLVLDLKDKIRVSDLFAGSGDGTVQDTASAAPGMAAGLSLSAREAMEALVALGYNGAEALKAVQRVEGAEGLNADEVLKRSLRNL